MMIPLTALMISSPAALAATPTADAPESWEDGTVLRAPHTAFAQVSTLATPLGNTPLLFADVHVGTPLFQLPDMPVTFGLSAHAGTSSSWVDDTSRTAARGVGGHVWLGMAYGIVQHGLSLGYEEPPGPDASFYRFHPAETGGRFVTQYVGEVDGGRLDWAFNGRAGLAEDFPVELVASVAAIYELAPAVALSLGGMVGAMPNGVLLTGVHLRPLDGVEVGLGVNLPFPMFGPPTVVRPEPALEVKLYR